jgi:hypothetical protein
MLIRATTGKSDETDLRITTSHHHGTRGSLSLLIKNRRQSSDHLSSDVEPEKNKGIRARCECQNGWDVHLRREHYRQGPESSL